MNPGTADPRAHLSLAARSIFKILIFVDIRYQIRTGISSGSPAKLRFLFLCVLSNFVNVLKVCFLSFVCSAQFLLPIPCQIAGASLPSPASGGVLPRPSPAKCINRIPRFAVHLPGCTKIVRNGIQDLHFLIYLFIMLKSQHFAGPEGTGFPAPLPPGDGRRPAI